MADAVDDPEVERIKRRLLREMLDAGRAKQDGPSHTPNNAVVELTSATFDRTISMPNPTLVDFWAEWCGPCKAMHPVFESLCSSYPHITFARVNVDACPDVSARFGIQSIPTFVMFRAGSIADRVMGAVGPQGIHAMCSRQPA